MWSTYLQQLEGITGFPGGSDGVESICSVGDLGSIPGLGRSPGEGHGNSSIPVWKIPWTEDPGGLHPLGHKDLNTTEQLSTVQQVPICKSHFEFSLKSLKFLLKKKLKIIYVLKTLMI